MHPIRTLDDLVDAELSNRAVVVAGWRNFKRPTPAAFIMNMPGWIIYRMIRGGMFLYEKHDKPTPAKPTEHTEIVIENEITI